jgi:protein-disulfide isomerase
MSEECPICGDEHRSDGALRTHAWDDHGACHFCGEEVPDEETLHRHWLTRHGGDLSKVERKRAESDVGEPGFQDYLQHAGLGGALFGSPVGRRAVIAGGVFGIAALGGAWASGALGDDGGETDGDDGGGSEAVASAPIPGTPGDHEYAVAGTDDPELTVTYYGSFKCPYCAQFSTGFLGSLIADYVEPGDVNIRYRNLSYFDGEPFLGPDAPNAGHAGLAVWNDDPASYWEFHEHVLANQPPESEEWATADRLATFADEAGVADPSVVRAAVEEGRYEEQLRSTAADASAAGIEGTPALIVGDRALSPFDEQATRDAIESELSN